LFAKIWVFDSYFGFLNDLSSLWTNSLTVSCEMPPSKLDKYLNILEVLVSRPQRIDQIAHKTRMEQHTLKRHLGSLVSNGVVEKRRLGEKVILYAITDRGLSVFKTLRAMKYLEKLKHSLPIVEEAREIASVLSKHSRDWKEE